MKIGRVKIHFSIWLMMLVFWYYKDLYLLAFTFLFVTLHEMSHCLVGVLWGAKVKEILITPIGERAILKGLEDLCTAKRIFVFLIGPVSNFLFAIIFFLLEDFMPLSSHLLTINLCLGLFNLLPLLPLDGGQALFTLCGYHFGTLPSARFFTKFSRMAGIFFVIVGVIQLVLYPYNATVLLIGFYIYQVNKKEYLKISLQFYKLLHNRYQNLKKRCRKVRIIFISNKMRLGEIINWFDEDHYYLLVYEKNKELQFLKEQDILKALFESGVNMELREVMGVEKRPL